MCKEAETGVVCCDIVTLKKNVCSFRRTKSASHIRVFVQSDRGVFCHVSEVTLGPHPGKCDQRVGTLRGEQGGPFPPDFWGRERDRRFNQSPMATM